jgi:hypothetical protein
MVVDHSNLCYIIPNFDHKNVWFGTTENKNQNIMTDNKSIMVASAVTAALAVGYYMGSTTEKKKHWSTEPKICDTILDHVSISCLSSYFYP